MTNILQAAAVAVITLGTGRAAVSVMKKDVPDFAVPAAPWQASHVLDGKVFTTKASIKETGEKLYEDTEFTFKDGGFQSSRCQIYCDFGWNTYQTWTEGDVTHFTATTKCPDAPHTVVWYGSIKGDDMKFEGSWTTRRWYWTRQMNIIGNGSPLASASQADSG